MMIENTDVDEPQNPLMSVPVEITVTVGSARPMVKDLLSMGPDSVVTLNRRIDDPVELYIGDKLIARGELTDVSGNGGDVLAVRITEVVNIQPTFPKWPAA